METWAGGDAASIFCDGLGEEVVRRRQRVFGDVLIGMRGREATVPELRTFLTEGMIGLHETKLSEDGAQR